MHYIGPVDHKVEVLVSEEPVFVVLVFVVLSFVVLGLTVRGPPVTGGSGCSTEYVGWGWIVTGTGAGKKLAEGTLARGTSVALDVMAVGVVTGKVA